MTRLEHKLEARVERLKDENEGLLALNEYWQGKVGELVQENERLRERWKQAFRFGERGGNTWREVDLESRLRRIEKAARAWAEEFGKYDEFVARGATDAEEALLNSLGLTTGKDNQGDWFVTALDKEEN